MCLGIEHSPVSCLLYCIVPCVLPKQSQPETYFVFHSVGKKKPLWNWLSRLSASCGHADSSVPTSGPGVTISYWVYLLELEI